MHNHQSDSQASEKNDSTKTENFYVTRSILEA